MSVTQAPNAADIIDEVRAIGTHAIHAAETVRADAQQQIHALEITVARLAEERDRERTRADLAEKAGIEIGNALVATMRRETQLTTRLRIALTHVRELERLHDDKHLEARRVAEHVARLVADNTDLRTELANQPKPWWRRRNQDH